MAEHTHSVARIVHKDGIKIIICKCNAQKKIIEGIHTEWEEPVLTYTLFHQAKS